MRWIVLAALLLSAPIARAQPEAIKVTVIVSGDPDSALQEAAHELDRAIDAHEALRRPVDPGLRNALFGDEGTPEDGLERLRAARRGLGLTEAADLPALIRIGEMTGARALAIVRANAGQLEVVVVDVGRRSFFSGTADAQTTEEALGFVLQRAQAAASAQAPDEPVESAPSASPRPPPDRRAEPAEEAADAQQAEDPTPPAEDLEDDDPGFFEEYWPYLVGALLLGAVVVWFSVPSSPADQGPPVLRFRPGGSP